MSKMACERLLAVLLASGVPSGATEPPVAAPPGIVANESGLRPVTPGVFQLGRVTLDKAGRGVSFPAVVNQTEGTIEYLVVHRNGKTHESVLRTEAQPGHIHIALLLLGARPAYTNQFPTDLSKPVPGEPVTIQASWRSGTGEKHVPLEDLAINKKTGQTLSRGRWVYNGSWFGEGSFVAERDGSIISTRIDPDALINNPRPGREDDDLYAVHTSVLPPRGVPIQVTISLCESKTNGLPQKP